MWGTWKLWVIVIQWETNKKFNKGKNKQNYNNCTIKEEMYIISYLKKCEWIVIAFNKGGVSEKYRSQMSLTPHLLKATTSTACASPRLIFPPKRFSPHLFASPAFALRLPRLSPLTARVFSTFQVSMGDAPDAGMDAVQRRLMFEDE